MMYEIEHPDGRIIEIESDKEPTTSQIRKAFLDQAIQTEKKNTMRQESPVISALFPRGAEANVNGAGLMQQAGASVGDVFSLAGRMIDSAKDFEGATIKDKLNNYLKSVGETEGEGFLSEVLRHPATGAALTMAPMLGGVAGVMTKAGIEGLGVAGVSQAARIGEGKDLSASEAMIDIGASLAMPGFGQVFKKYAPEAKAQVLKATERMINPALKNITSSLSGISNEALEAASTKSGRNKLLAVSGKATEIGQSLLQSLDNIDEVYKYNDKLNLALDNMPDISTKSLVLSLQESKIKNAIGKGLQSNQMIDNFIKDVEALGPKISAKDYRNLRGQIDAEIGDSWGKDASGYIKALKSARSEAKNELLAASKDTPYSETMEQYSKALDARERIYKTGLGKDDFTREQRVESWINNLYGKNKTARQEILKDVDNVFGSDFTEQTKLVALSNEVVKDGVIPWINMQSTGRSLMGTLGGAGVAGYGAITGNLPAVLGGATSMVLQSPQLAPRVLGSTRGIANAPDLATKIMTNPYLQQTIPGLARIQLREE